MAVKRYFTRGDCAMEVSEYGDFIYADNYDALLALAKELRGALLQAGLSAGGHSSTGSVLTLIVGVLEKAKVLDAE